MVHEGEATERFYCYYTEFITTPRLPGIRLLVIIAPLCPGRRRAKREKKKVASFGLGAFKPVDRHCALGLLAWNASRDDATGRAQSAGSRWRDGRKSTLSDTVTCIDHFLNCAC